RKAWPLFGAGEEFVARGALADEQPLTPTLSRTPSPERRLQTIALPSEVGDRVIGAADAVALAVLDERFVVCLMKPRQIGDDVAGEPGERLGAARATHRQLEIVAAPQTFDVSPRRHEPLAQEQRALPLFKSMFPERGQQRLPRPRARVLGRAARQVRE